MFLKQLFGQQRQTGAFVARHSFLAQIAGMQDHDGSMVAFRGDDASSDIVHALGQNAGIV